MKAISSGIQAWSLALGLVAFMALIAIMVGCAPSRLQPPKAIAPTTVPGYAIRRGVGKFAQPGP